MQTNKLTRTILLSYFSYLILFVGTAFVSGAIVHVGNISELYKYIVIGTLGIAMFITGSFIQEFVINKDNQKNEGIVKFFLFSLMLSIGIGMISGGTQHYSDFPTYSSYLIPIGLVLSLVAYLLKNNYHITSKLWATIVGVFLLISIPLHFGLIALANNLNTQSAKEKAELCTKKTGLLPFTITAQASGGHGDEKCPTNSKTSTNPINKSNCQAGQSEKAMPGICMPDDGMNSSGDKMMMNDKMLMPNTSKVKDDKTFIQYVIPHHQDAIDSSNKILTTTQDPELKAFTANVIKTQGQEIASLTSYYKTWYGTEYSNNGNYKPMIMLENPTEKELDKSYIQMMLGHHSGIIDVAKKVVSDTKSQYKPEIITLSKQIIRDQEADNVVLQKWLDTKYKNLVVTTPAPTTIKTNSQTLDNHDESDGHSGH